MSEELKWVKEKLFSNAVCGESYQPPVIQSDISGAIGWDNPWQGPCTGDGRGSLSINEFGT